MPSSSSGNVSFQSPRGRISYRDSRDHFENGLLRLLNLDVAALRAMAGLGRRRRRARPADRARACLPAPAPPAPGAGPLPGKGEADADAGPAGEPGAIWQPRIAESPAFGVARAADGALGWLVRPEPHEGGGRWVRETEPPEYEEAYFEGDPTQAGGYGDYAAQEGWRLEKAQRQVRELAALGAVGDGGRALDVGSGYGFFRGPSSSAASLTTGSRSRRTPARSPSASTASTPSATIWRAARRWSGRFDLITCGT